MMLRKLLPVCLCLLCLPPIAAGGEAAPCADGTAALVDWWKVHRYVG
jgi:hypothetical protein